MTLPTKLKPGRSPQRKSGTPDEGGGAPKFRSKMLGLSVTGDGGGAALNERDESASGDAQEQREYVAQMEQELARRQESYVRRERQYKVRIAELEAQLTETRAKKTKENAIDATMDRLRSLHRAIIENVDHVQDRTSKILQDQEKDLLRAFRARLYSVQEELESEKNKTDDGASAWIEKSKQLETEVEWTKELADRLDRLNQSLTRENQRLKMQFTTQENDREFLVKQLVTVKKDNVRLRSEFEAAHQQLEELQDDLGRPHASASSSAMGSAASTGALPRVVAREASHRALSRPTTAAGAGSAMASAAGASVAALEADNRYKDIIKRLKRVLDVERRNLQQVRAAYKSELQNRTELEMILKECIHDVRGEIASASAAPASHPSTPVLMPAIASASSSRRLESSGGGSGSTGTLVSDHLRLGLGAVERQRLIEKLLAKERLLNLLTTRAFPIKNGKAAGDPLLTGDAVSPEEMARIYADVASLTAQGGEPATHEPSTSGRLA